MAIFKEYTSVVLSLALILLMPVIHSNAQSIESNQTIKKLVIDPGHGGNDPGTVGIFFMEKDVVLGVSLRFGRLIEEHFPEIEVLYTRKKDVYVELIDRAKMANDADADLFISIHVNGFSDRSVRGAETFVLGPHRADDNLKVAQRENKVITLEEDYETKYEGFNPDSPESYIIFHLMQNAYLEQSFKFAEIIQEELIKGPIVGNRGVKQDAFLVLWQTAAPSVLVELGFLSNIEEGMLLGDPDVQELIAKRLFDAFKRYKNSLERV